MNHFDATPPRTAQALATVFLRQREIDAVTGDLLEEYRAEKRPALGKLRANSGTRRKPWASPSPGTSMLDALILVWAAYYGPRRTGRTITGVATTIVTALAGFGSFFVYAVVTQPSLLLAPVQTPFVIVIVCILLAVAMAFALTAGALGAAAARWSRSTTASPAYSPPAVARFLSGPRRRG